MRIHLFGSTGMLGQYVRRYLAEKGLDVAEITRAQCEIVKLVYADLPGILAVGAEDVVINCAGIIPQRQNHKDYYTVNTIFPLLLARYCCEQHCHFIHVSTDCVFDGTTGAPYDENSLHTETNPYGLSKSFGESPQATIIRSSIIGEEQTDPKTSFLEFVRQTPNLRGYTRHQWNGITCLQMAKIMYSIILKKMYWKGVRHVFSPDAHSKYDLACLIKNVYALDRTTIEPWDTGVDVDKTLGTVYDACRSFAIPSLRTQLIEQRYFSGLSQPRISIVMGYYNRLSQLETTMRSIQKSVEISSSVEIIIVDDGSDDNHRIPSSLMSSVGCTVKIVRIEKADKTWWNPVIAYNLGITMARGEWILLQNPEIAHIGDIISHVLHHCHPDRYHAFHVFAPALADVGLDPFEYREIQPQLGGGSFQGIWYCHKQYRNRAYHFCTAIHQSILKKIGGFNATMKDGIEYDDDELLCRIERACPVEFIDDQTASCLGIHQWHPSFNYDHPDKDRLKAQNKAIADHTMASSCLLFCDPFLNLPTCYTVRISTNGEVFE